MTRPPLRLVVPLLVVLGACGGEAPSTPDAAPAPDALADALPPPSEQPPPDGAPSWCPAPGAVCAGGCVDLSRDPSHCGVCDRGCLNGTTCIAGACAYPRPDGGIDALDAAPDLIVADDRASPPDVTEVGTDAHVAPDVTPCVRGFIDCDGNATNGCETSVLGDPINCGGCGRLCPWIGSELATCTDGACGVVCSPGFANCPASQRGCNTSLTTTVAHCGRCNMACGPFTRAASVCDVGRCIMGACSPNYANCDGNTANGCEVDTRSDTTACGGCGRMCADGEQCLQGLCCQRGSGAICGGRCVNLTTDTANCGGCGRSCGELGTCDGARCVAGCPPGEARCGGICMNITEDPTNCGACGNRCILPEQQCTAGRCVPR